MRSRAKVRKWVLYGELLEQLESRADDKTRRLEGWPKAARSLSGVMKRLAPNLRTAGVGVEFGRQGRKGRKVIELWRQQEVNGNSASVASAASASAETWGFDDYAADAKADANWPAEANADATDDADANPFEAAAAPNAAFAEDFSPADATDDADALLQPHSNPWPDTPF